MRNIALFSVVIVLLLIGLLLAFWNYRIGNPGYIDVVGRTGKYSSDGIDIVFPIDTKNVTCGYYHDGGTLMVSATDALNRQVFLCLDHRLGRVSDWGDVYYGVKHPSKAGGINLGKSEEWTKIVYSIGVHDEKLDYFGNMSIDYWYPKVGTVICKNALSCWYWIKRVFA